MRSDTVAPGNTKASGGLYSSLIFISLLLTLCTLALSAYIRLAQSGLDCSPWPACYGHIGTVAEEQGIAVLTEAGAEMSHKGARMVHRFVASVLGITVTLILLLAIKRKIRGQPGLSAALGVMGATLFLAVLGYSTPSRTLPWITLGNLGGGMLMAALLWWLGQRSVVGTRQQSANEGLNSALPIIGLLLLSAQILSGAWVSANFAATACGAELLCNSIWSSGINFSDSFSLTRELTINEQGTILLPENMAQSISLVHRGLALLCTLYLGYLAYRLLNAGALLSTTAKAMLVFLSLELLLGIASVYFQLPLILVTLHNLLAALLLLTTVNALHHLTGHKLTGS